MSTRSRLVRSMALAGVLLLVLAPFYSRDMRNPGGSPQWLYFAGTGINSGSWWLAAEDRSLPSGADADLDDVVCYFETSPEGPYATQVQRASWGQLKARFR